MKKYINLIALVPLLIIPFVSNGCSTISNTFFLTDVKLSKSDATEQPVFPMFVDHAPSRLEQKEVTPQLSDQYDCEDVRVAYSGNLEKPTYEGGNNWRNGNSADWVSWFNNANINIEYHFRVDISRLKNDTKKWIADFNTDKDGVIQLTWDIWEQTDKNNSSHLPGDKYIYSKTRNSLYASDTTMNLAGNDLTIKFNNVPFNVWFMFGFSMGATFTAMGKNKELINKFNTSPKNTFIADKHRNKYQIGIDNSLNRDYFSIFFQYKNCLHGRLTTE